MNRLTRAALLLWLVIAVTLSGDEQKEQPPGDKPPMLHEHVLVTATLQERRARDLSAAVSVVGRDELIASGASNALAAASGVPGLFVHGNGDFGRADVDIRGLGGNGQKIGVLVDGRPEKMALFGCVVSPTFPLLNVERIEVVKGPASVLYGSDALAGVVNIITRRPERKAAAGIVAAYGAYDTLQLNLHASGRSGAFAWQAAWDRRRSDGHVANSQYRGDVAGARLEWRAGAGLELALLGKYYDGLKHEAGAVDRPLPDFWNDYRRGAIELRLTRERGRGRLNAQLFRNFGRHVFSDGWNSRDFSDGLLLNWVGDDRRGRRLTLGLDLRRFSGTRVSLPGGSWSKTEAALFAMAEVRPAAVLTLAAGARVQTDSVFGTALVPQGGAVLQLGRRTDLRLHAAAGLRSPQINELFLFPSSNPDLRPERLWTLEAGVEHRFGDRLRLSAALFRLNGSQFIELAPAPGQMPPFRFQNTGALTFWGYEVGVDALAGRSWNARAFYSRLHPGERTRGRPGNKLDTRLGWKSGRLSASASGQWVSDYFARDGSQGRLPAYVLVDGRAAWRVERRVELFVEVKNLLDEQYLSFLDLPGSEGGAYRMPGRHANIGVSVTF